MSLVQRLERSLDCRQSELIGCWRQNRLRGEDTSWRNLRGNALCAQLGYKIRASTPVDDFDVFFRPGDEDHGDSIITFRGGNVKPWWTDDLKLLGALAKLYICETLKSVLVLHELDAGLHTIVVPVPTVEECNALVQDALNKWKNMDRIKKDSPRAKVLCQYCPVWRQCDSMDLERGEMYDWNLTHAVG